MFLLSRSWAGWTSNMGVFDTLEKAQAFETACRACHAINTYSYVIRPIAFNLGAGS